MAKRSNGCPVRHEKDQSGCMWGLISMLDFRHSRSTQRLLSIRRRRNGNAVVVGNAGNKLMLTSSAETCPRPLDGEEETAAIDACKLTVKKLLEEEMNGGKIAMKEAYSTEVEAKQFDSKQGDDGRKKRKRKNKTCKKSFGNNLDMDVAKEVVSEGSYQHKPEQQTTSNLDIDNLMEEFFRRVHQKNINCVNHDQLERNEAIKFLVSRKLLNWDQLTEDGEIRASKEVMDALQISSLDEELFLKLLQDPNSLSKYVLDSSDAHLNDEESKLVAESNCSDVEYVYLRQHNEPVNRKDRNFFGRKSKSQERELSDGNKASQASNKIVILKPGPTSLQTPDTGSSTISSSESRYLIGKREPNEKVGSHFFLAEIKRKLKHAMGRDQHRIPTDGISERFTELSTEYETIDLSRRRYIEGKNHLSELLANGDKNVDLSSAQVLKTIDGNLSSAQVLKTIDGNLSLQEYNSSPVHSTGQYSEPSFRTAQSIFAGSEKSEKTIESNQVNLVSNLRQMKEKSDSRLCSSNNKTCKEVEGDNAISDNLDTHENNDEDDPVFCSTKDEMSSEDSASVVETTEIMVHEESKLLDSSPLASPSNTSITRKVDFIESFADIKEWSSPISVLQPIFTDDLISPASIKYSSGETFIQPLRIRFEEHNTLATDQSNRFKACMDDKDSIFENIKTVLQASSFNWDELYIHSLSSEVLINPLSLDEVKYLPNELCQDRTLLFDCINEVLVEFCRNYFGCPGISFVKPSISPLPNMNNTIQEVTKGVYRHLLPIPLPCTLDLIIRKDLAKSGTWMDLQLDTGCIGVEIGEAIFEDLVGDTITSCINESRNCKYNVFPA
ncbi:putative Polyamine-modulated factor 1-binding protein 1 [Hibiscus syriacus]|uniref:Polyamine-modulated factor 1-binding protein 1 n=1 Tax=Hibiscus syriacus TaxID=106335 RepID=A0A6A2ZWC0_HIBSY|nr:uncharacterized protein LOC120138770 [Hibiscus syriacus]KAE8695559.1 putative Polyamine-modulated factor 1-binding protein 1 [Hibiscus syriacus]